MFPAIAVKNPQENLAISQYLIFQRDNIHARNHDTCVDICRQDDAICSKNRKIVPDHGSAWIPGLTVSVLDYGSCTYPYGLSRGQTVIISKRQGLCRIKLCGLRSVNVSYNLRSEVHCMQSVICSLQSAVILGMDFKIVDLATALSRQSRPQR